VFPTIASRFNDPGVNRLFAAICAALAAKQIGTGAWKHADTGPTELTTRSPLIPGARTRYLAEIAQGARAARARIEAQVEAARRAFGLYESLKALHDAALPGPLERFAHDTLNDAAADATRRELRAAYNRALDEIAPRCGELQAWPARVRSATDATYSYKVRDRMVTGENYTRACRVRRCRSSPCHACGLGRAAALHPPGESAGLLSLYRRGVSLPREEEDPTRMFAGEGAPERTNRRFHYLAAGHGAARLSTAFDSLRSTRGPRYPPGCLRAHR